MEMAMGFMLHNLMRLKRTLTGKKTGVDFYSSDRRNW
jgi:hypothetical protein